MRYALQIAVVAFALLLTFKESILRHGGEAGGVRAQFQALSPTQQNQIITFLKSL
jgi:CxxC motif-containing protein (DUF1111 family)